MEVAVSGSVILAGARTPIGRLLGSLKDFTGAQLGGIAIKAALEQAGVSPDAVQYTIMGQVLTAGAGQIPARQAAVAAGIPMDIPALTINKVCLSGLDAIALADQLIRAGEFDIVVAGGQESMTQAPHLLPKSRSGFKYGDTTLVDHMAYEGVRGDTTAESLAKLRPAFSSDGTITAGSASQISDGAAAVVVMSKAKAEELGLSWIAEIGAHGVVAGPDASLHEQPSNAIKAALAREDLKPGDLDLVEINEAFAAVGVVSTKQLGLDPALVNVNGGAIALGHPIGASGARLVVHLAYELRRRCGGLGVAALCGGGGQGDALIIRVPKG